MACRIQKTTFLKVTIQGQIQGQRTGTGQREKLATDLTLKGDLEERGFLDAASHRG